MAQFTSKTDIRKYYEKDYFEMYHSIDEGDIELKYSMIKPFLDGIPLRGKKVLDIGCGMGGMLSIISREHGAIPVGSDLSFKQLKTEPINRYPRLQADAERLPFDKPAFGLTYFVDLLEHLPSPDEFLVHLRAFSENILMFVPMESAILNDFIHHLRKIRGKRINLEKYGHIHRFNLKKLKGLLRNSGLRSYEFKVVLYDDFNKYESIKGKILNLFSRLCFKVSPFVHRIIFGGHAFIALCKGDVSNV